MSTADSAPSTDAAETAASAAPAGQTEEYQLFARATEAMNNWTTERNPRLGPQAVPPVRAQDQIFQASPDALAVHTTTHAGTDNPLAHWNSRTEHFLQVALATPDPGALAELIDQWRTYLSQLEEGLPPDFDSAADGAHPRELLHAPYRGLPGDRNAACVIPTAMDFAPRVMNDAGFFAYSSSAVRAVRDADAQAGEAFGKWWESPYTFADGLVLRGGRDEDFPQLLELTLAIHDADYQAGCNSQRENLPELYTPWVKQFMEFTPSSLAIIESGDKILGFASLNPVADSHWYASETSIAPIRYLGFLSVRAGMRGQRIGARLMTAAHATAATSGARGVLTQFASLSSYSPHFYYRLGYSPLVHVWKTNL